MQRLILAVLLMMSMTGLGCQSAPKNRVIVLGMIHSGHTSSDVYSLEVLREAIIEIEPDYVLTEIPPDRIENANSSFAETGVVDEARVNRFPEYTGVLYPLTREMNFEIIACAAWTREMAQDRQEKLDLWSTERPVDTMEVENAQYLIEIEMAEKGDPNDPMYIHTDGYDELVRQAMEPYNRLFNDDLGPGGWDNINKAHYALIEAALDEHSGEGKTILITFGAWHKYWFLDRLRKRDDIRLIDPRSFFE